MREFTLNTQGLELTNDTDLTTVYYEVEKNDEELIIVGLFSSYSSDHFIAFENDNGTRQMITVNEVASFIN